MDTSPNREKNQNDFSNEITLNNEFISNINILSDSIKEYFNVSKNVNNNKVILLKTAETELQNLESNLNSLVNKEINKNEIISLQNSIIAKLRDILNKIYENILSENNNLVYFFEDAKILFKNMKEKRKEIYTLLKKRSLSVRKMAPRTVIKNMNKTKNSEDIIAYYNQSALNSNIRVNLNSISDYKNINNYKKLQAQNNANKNMVERNSKPNYINTDYNIGDPFYNKSGPFEKLNRTSSQSINNKYNKEIENLKMINTKLHMDLQKLRSKEIDKISNESLKNETNINKIIETKNKLIIALEERLNENNKKYNELLNSINNYKLEIIQLKDENNLLKSNSLSNNTNKGLNKLISTDENSYPKTDVEEFQQKSYNFAKVDNNSQLHKNLNLYNAKYTDLNKTLLEKNKIISVLTIKNKELNNSLNLRNKELIKIKKEYINKINELKKAQPLNLSEVHNKTSNTSSIHNNSNAQINQNEIERLKLINTSLQEKIIHFQAELRNNKNEMKKSLELVNAKEKVIKETKEDCQKQILKLKNINKSLLTELDEQKNIKSELDTQMSNLNQQIVSKDVQILELNYQI